MRVRISTWGRHWVSWAVMLVALAGVTIGVSAGLHQDQPVTIKPMDLGDPARVREALAFDPFHPDVAAEPAGPTWQGTKMAAVSLGVLQANGPAETGKPAAGKGVTDAGGSAAAAGDGRREDGTERPAGEGIASAAGDGKGSGGGPPKGPGGGGPKAPAKPSPVPPAKAGGLTAGQQGLIWAGAIAAGAVGTASLVIAVSDANNSSRSPAGR